MLFKSQSTESASKAAPKDSQEREQYQRDFETKYMLYYKNRAWSELKQFLEDSISTLDKASAVPYAKRAEYLVNFNASLARSLYGIPEIDSLLVKYDLYTILFTHLADVYITTEQYDVALERLFHLGLVCHSIRVDLFNAVNILGTSNEASIVDFDGIHKELCSNGIRLDGVANIVSSKDILNHLVDYWCHEVSIEIWSRFVKIWLGESSSYVVVSKINAISLPWRFSMLESICFDFANYTKPLDSADDFVLKLNVSTDDGYSILSASYILEYILNSPFSSWPMILEGFIFVAQLIRETDSDAYCFLYMVMHNVSRLYFTVVGMNELVNAHGDKWGSIVYKHVGLKGVKATFKIPLVFHAIDSQNAINALSTSVSLINVPMYVRFSEQCSVANMDLTMPLGGMSKYLHLSKQSFEAQVWLDLYHAPRVDVDFGFSVEINVKSRNAHCTVSNAQETVDLKVGDLVPFQNISIDGISIDAHLKFDKMGFRLNRRRDMSGVMLDSVLCCKRQHTPIVIGIKDNVMFSLIAYCFVLDKMSTILNFMQCNEFLQFRNTFLRRKRTCCCSLCGCIKYRANPGVKNMLTFQRYIRGVFKHKVLGICSGTKGSSHTGALKQKTLADLNRKKGLVAKLGFPDGFKFFLKKSRVTYGSKHAYLVRNVDHLKGTIRGFVLSLKRKPKSLVSEEPYTIENMDNAKCTDAQRCIHQYFQRDSLCTEPPWQHLNHLVVVLDWLCHYCFTNFLDKPPLLSSFYNMDSSTSLVLSKSSSFILEEEQMDKTLVFIECLFKALKRSDVMPVFQPSQTSCLYILNELLENAILFSQATFFNQGHYKALVARLAIIQLYQGRWNLSIQLFKQAIASSKVLYKVGCTPGIMDDDDENDKNSVGSNKWDSSFCFDVNTIRLLLAKITLNVNMTPHVASEFIKPLLDHEEVGPLVTAKAHMAMALCIVANYPNVNNAILGDFLEPFEHFYNIPKVSHLTIGNESYDFLSTFRSTFADTDSYLEFFSPNNTADFTKHQLEAQDVKVNSDNDKTGEVAQKHVLNTAMKHMIQCISLDPLDYKGWLLLAQVAMFGHDYWFSRRCALYSLDLCNTCLGSWLTLAVVSSSRVKTCAPLSCSKDLWLEHVYECKSSDSVCEMQSFPIPLDCIFETNIVRVADLVQHVSRGVGGDVSWVLQKLHSLRVYKSIYIASAFVELAATISEYNMPMFSWEAKNEQMLASCMRNDHTSRPILKKQSSISKTRRIESRSIMELVNKVVDANKFICCMPFINILINMLMPGMGTFECVHHHQQQFDPNCNDGVLDYKVLQEEVFGWLCFLESCTRLGHYQIAHELLPIVKGYMQIYNLKRTMNGTFTTFNDNRAGVETSAFVRGKFSEVIFSSSNVFTATNLNLQLEHLELEIATHYCFNVQKLNKMLYDIQDACTRNPSRHLDLLQIRVMVGLQMYRQATCLCARVFKRGFVANYTTDYSMEGSALEAYAVALLKCGKVERSKLTCAFAQVLHKTAPTLKLSHCLQLSMFFGNCCCLDIEIDADPSRAFVYIDPIRKGSKCPVFSDGDDISGTAFISLNPGKRLEHLGIKVELIGQSDTLYNNGGIYNFFVMSREIEPAGTLMESKQYRWKFPLVGLENETYWGVNIKLYYLIRITILKSYGGNIYKDANFAIQNLSAVPDINNTIKMEVGIEDSLHIEFEYNKSKYHLNDVILGKVYFMLVGIAVKSMEISIQKVETITVGKGVATETVNITKFEIMDGAPIKGECIPVRLYLNGLDTCPSYKNVQNKLSVRHYINLTILDEHDKRYFKRQEIELWRSCLG